ncbi:hypothetical protein ACFLQ5_01970 [Bacteroidota bacterium]
MNHTLSIDEAYQWIRLNYDFFELELSKQLVIIEGSAQQLNDFKKIADKGISNPFHGDSILSKHLFFPHEYKNGFIFLDKNIKKLHDSIYTRGIHILFSEEENELHYLSEFFRYDLSEVAACFPQLKFTHAYFEPSIFINPDTSKYHQHFNWSYGKDYVTKKVELPFDDDYEDSLLTKDIIYDFPLTEDDRHIWCGFVKYENGLEQSSSQFPYKNIEWEIHSYYRSYPFMEELLTKMKMYSDNPSNSLSDFLEQKPQGKANIYSFINKAEYIAQYGEIVKRSLILDVPHVYDSIKVLGDTLDDKQQVEKEIKGILSSSIEKGFILSEDECYAIEYAYNDNYLKNDIKVFCNQYLDFCIEKLVLYQKNYSTYDKNLEVYHSLVSIFRFEIAWLDFSFLIKANHWVENEKVERLHDIHENIENILNQRWSYWAQKCNSSFKNLMFRSFTAAEHTLKNLKESFLFAEVEWADYLENYSDNNFEIDISLHKIACREIEKAYLKIDDEVLMSGISNKDEVRKNEMLYLEFEKIMSASIDHWDGLRCTDHYSYYLPVKEYTELARNSC